MKKNQLDERQERIVEKIGSLSFYVMFSICTIVIIAQLIWKGNLENVIGETLVFLAGGITCMAGCIKNGIWTGNGRKMSLGQNLLLSVICSGIFSILFALAIGRKAGDNVDITKYVGMFFAGITVLCFLCLCTLGKVAQIKKEKQEKKYSE